MPLLRYDHTTADWVVFAPLRKLRPHHEASASAPADEVAADVTTSCPFCPGNERMTPPEIYAIRPPNSDRQSDWRVRVTSNKFPALRIEEDHHRVDEGRVFQMMGGCGAHEVVVESPDHFLFLGQQPAEQVELVLRAAQARYVDLLRDKRFQSVIIFKNHKEAAGTSLHHPHWQIIATPVVPRLLRLKHNEATEYFDRTGTSVYRLMMEEEMQAQTRLVCINRDFVAFVPYAAHLPFETWILPRDGHTMPFGRLEGRQMRTLAEILKVVLLKLFVALENPAFNLTIDMPPRGDEEQEYFQWHIRILPRLSTPAGFELGSGMAINTTMPEDAASFLRNGDRVEL